MQEWKADPKWLGLSPISRDNLPILYAIVEHTAWVYNLISYIEGICSSIPEQDHHECRFGQWLYSLGPDHYKESTEFELIKKIHQEIHLKSKTIIQAKDASSDNLENEILELREIHKSLVNLLDKL